MVTTAHGMNGSLPDFSAVRGGPVPARLAPLFETERRTLTTEGVEAAFARLCNPAAYSDPVCPLIRLEGATSLEASFALAGGATFKWSGDAPISVRRDFTEGGAALLIECGAASVRVSLHGLKAQVWKDEVQLVRPGTHAPEFECSIRFAQAFHHQPKSVSAPA